MAKLGKRDGLKHHCPKGLAGSNPAPGTLRGRADRRVRGPSGPAAERPGAGSTAATARRRTPEGEYDATYPRTLRERRADVGPCGAWVRFANTFPNCRSREGNGRNATVVGTRLERSGVRPRH